MHAIPKIATRFIFFSLQVKVIAFQCIDPTIVQYTWFLPQLTYTTSLHDTSQSLRLRLTINVLELSTKTQSGSIGGA